MSFKIYSSFHIGLVITLEKEKKENGEKKEKKKKSQKKNQIEVLSDPTRLSQLEF